MNSELLAQQKLASLGLLSAGIAHEIQNPLNFVINFSKMSERLLADLMEAMEDIRPKISDDEAADLMDIATDLSTNMEKIKEHGERAISIIQGILLISRGKEGERISTDVAHLVHEYVWLAYHAQRANDKSFNVNIKEDYQPDMPKMMVIPQDLSRAVLNIMNNALYAVHDRASREGEDFMPAVSVSVALKNCDGSISGGEGSCIAITIADNGCGIPDDIKQQLFSQAVTTKPVGKGTGLGMMITHDLIVKNLKGSITIDSTVNEGTTINITIPVQ